jgi:hypothetical protein
VGGSIILSCTYYAKITLSVVIGDGLNVPIRRWRDWAPLPEIAYANADRRELPETALA